jgi:glycosyltransferase involved in cell wall biosynthesis
MVSRDTKPSVLIVVAEFPPLGGGGVIRATKLAKYLDRIGWQVTVVSMDETAPTALDPSLSRDIPSSVSVVRVRGPFGAVGAVAKRTRSVGRSPLRLARRLARSLVASLATPDRWVGWALAASRVSRERAGDPDVIVSSGPPHSGHIAGDRLSRRFGVPLVLDFRDEWHENPLYQSSFPWRSMVDRRFERSIVGRATAAVFVSDVSRDRYAARYPHRASRFLTIPNGFDPEDFDAPAAAGNASGGVVSFVHTGSIHGRRDARPLFAAFGRFARTAPVPVRLQLIGPIVQEQEAFARATIDASALVLHGFVPHAEAIDLMRRADVLVGLSNSAEAGPAAQTGKVFEYLIARRPILMLAPPSPARELVETANAGVVADPTDEQAIHAGLDSVLHMARFGAFEGATKEFLDRYDRRVQAQQWSALLMNAIGDGHESQAVDQSNRPRKP